MDHFIRMLCISWLNIWINKQIEVCILVVFYLRIVAGIYFQRIYCQTPSLRAIACSITQVAIIVNDIIISDIKQNQIVCEVSIESY